MKYSWKLDSFDSEVFGFKVVRVETIDSENVKDLIKDLIKNKVKYATHRVQSNNFSTIHALEESGFILVDGLITFKINISNLEIEESVGHVREGNNDDLRELKNLTSGLFSTGRIMNDPFIPKDKGNQFYIKWIENSILGKVAESVLVWEENKEILGYITLKKKGQISLVGVSPQSRGKGIAKNLIKASLKKFKAWKLDEIIVETQMDNISAIRLYQDCGFKVVNSFLTLRWAKDD